MNDPLYSDKSCRLCLWNNHSVVHIFSEESEKHGIAKKICSLLPFTISRNDPFPKYICQNCLYKLEVCYDFCAQCTRSDKKLKCNNTFTVHPEQEHAPKLENVKDSFAIEFEDIQYTACSVGVENTGGNQSSPALGFNDDSINGDNKQPYPLITQESLNSVPGEHKKCRDTSGNKQWSTDTGSADVSAAETVDATISTAASTSANFLTADIALTANIPAAASAATTAGIAPSCTSTASSSMSKDTRKETTMITLPHEAQVHVCGKCSQKFESKALLILHYCNTPLSNQVSCRYCDKPFNNMEQLVAHKKVHVNPLSFSCKSCGKEFHTVKSLRDHTNSEHHMVVDLHTGINNELQKESRKSKTKIHTEAKVSNKTASKMGNETNDPQKGDRNVNDKMDESEGKPKRVRRKPYLDSSWILGDPLRKYALKY